MDTWREISVNAGWSTTIRPPSRRPPSPDFQQRYTSAGVGQTPAVRRRFVISKNKGNLSPLFAFLHKHSFQQFSQRRLPKIQLSGQGDGRFVKNARDAVTYTQHAMANRPRPGADHCALGRALCRWSRDVDDGRQIICGLPQSIKQPPHASSGQSMTGMQLPHRAQCTAHPDVF